MSPEGFSSHFDTRSAKQNIFFNFDGRFSNCYVQYEEMKKTNQSIPSSRGILHFLFSQSHEGFLFVNTIVTHCVFSQQGTKATQSRGNHPWSQVLHRFWRKGGQPVHTGCQTWSQNCYGLQGMAPQSKFGVFVGF